MVQIMINNQTVQWNGPGLPLESFRVFIRGSRAEYRPENISESNRQLRSRTLNMLRSHGSLLSAGLIGIIQQTSSLNGIEHSAFILNDGQVTSISRGTGSHAPVGTPPAGNVIGFVHTHPTPAAVLAPPSANDYCIRFQQYPTQLVAEMGGRIWQLFEFKYSSLLGAFNPSREFVELTDSSTSLVYRVVDADTLAMESLERERDQVRNMQNRQAEAMRRLAEQRQREAEIRRNSNRPQ